MTVVDFIDVIDDIIDLSSDEETVEEHIATQHNGEETVDDRQGVFVLADEGMQDAQATFVSVGEGSQEATESEDALVATASPSVMERAPLDTIVLKNCPSSPASAPLPSPTSTTAKALTSEVGDTQLVTTSSPSVMEKVPFGTAESENCPRSPASAPVPSKLFSIPLSVVSPTTLKALTSEVGDAKLVRVKHPNKNYQLVRVKHPKKNYHTSTPRRSHRLHECCNNSAEELAGDHKTSRA